MITRIHSKELQNFYHGTYDIILKTFTLKIVFTIVIRQILDSEHVNMPPQLRCPHNEKQ